MPSSPANVSILPFSRGSEADLTRVASMIPYGRQTIDEDDIAAVVEALSSDFLTTGPRVEAFEQAFAESCGAKHAVACANGTAALHLAMLAAGVGEGDRIVTSPNTFLASANAGAFVGAEVDFCDVEPVAATLDAGALEEQWREGIRAVVAVDYAGHPADHERIGALAHARGAVLIADACHSVGGTLCSAGGIPHRIGGLPWVDLTAFSFHPVKTMTTGEGGMVTTQRDDLAEKLRLFRNHGLVRDPARFQAFGKPGPLAEAGPWSYEMQVLGYNYRLTDFQCALGLSQLRKLDAFVARREAIVATYNEAFAGLPGVATPGLASWQTRSPVTAWHLYVLRIDFEVLGRSRTQVVADLAARGVGTQMHYIPVHLQPYYRQGDRGNAASLPVAEAFYQRCLSLPLWPGMTDGQVDEVCRSVKAVLAGGDR